MTQDAAYAYLESQVHNATPQRLRLLLIECALRRARQAQAGWETGESSGAARESLSKCRAIVAELAAVIRTDRDPVAGQVAAIYLFLLRELTHFLVLPDLRRLEGVIRVLESERETWQQLCGMLPEPPAGWSADRHRQPEITAGGMAAIPPDRRLPRTPGTPLTRSEISWEA